MNRREWEDFKQGKNSNVLEFEIQASLLQTLYLFLITMSPPLWFTMFPEFCFCPCYHNGNHCPQSTCGYWCYKLLLLSVTTSWLSQLHGIFVLLLLICIFGSTNNAITSVLCLNSVSLWDILGSNDSEVK